MKPVDFRVKYGYGGLAVTNSDVRVCLGETRKLFDLPTKQVIRAERLKYVITVSDTPSPEAVKIRRIKKQVGFSEENRMQIRNLDDTRWRRITFYYDTETVLLRLFEKSGDDTLYVTIAED